MTGDFLIALPADVGSRIAHAKYGVQQQVQLTRAGAYDQIDAGDGVGETFAGCGSHLLDTKQQRHADGDGADGQQGSAATVTK